jgi:betaine-aldehyde dehydrogenase
LGGGLQANDQDIEAAVNSSEKAFHIWKNKTGAERGRGFIKSSPYIKIQVGEICFFRNSGCWKAHFGISGCDISSAADALEYFGGMAAGNTWESFFDLKNAFGYTRPEPLGYLCGNWCMELSDSDCCMEGRSSSGLRQLNDF